MSSRITAPHHDGSPLYVSSLTPLLGETVRVRLRVPRQSAVDAVHIRTTPDGEQEFTKAERVVDERLGVESDHWWQADVRCHNSVTNYRFLLSRSCDNARAGADPVPPLASYEWINADGQHERDVPDASDFRIVTYPAPPGWALGSVAYQVFPDRFARDDSVEPRHAPGAARTDLPHWAIPAAWDDPVDVTRHTGPQQVFGGTLRGVTEHLDHIESLGANVVYLTPFFPARSNHRYDAMTFDEVDPILGGTPALLDLQRAAHQRGLIVMGDITTNHTGEEHEWFRSAVADPTGTHAAWYVRHTEADRDDGYVSWLGVGTLPKLDHTNPALRTAMITSEDSAIKRWLGPTQGIDGWRVDVANMTGRYRGTDVARDVATLVRAAVEEVGAQRRCEPLLIAEHTHDHSADALGDGWHGVMNYSGFTKPVWTWLRDEAFAPKFLGSPVRVPRLGGGQVAATMRHFASIVPWRTVTHSFTLIGSHDTTRVRTLVGDRPELVEVAAGLLFTLPGIPMVTYGDEIGMPGDFGEDGRRPMPWTARGRDEQVWDEGTFATYRALIQARRSRPELHSGGLRWLHTEDDAMVFLREHPEGSALVHVARRGHRAIRLPVSLLPGIAEGQQVIGPSIRIDENRVTLDARGPTVRVWRWSPIVPDWA